jgi:EmrB/QacA subfamily drug resistance transporter
MRTQPTTKGGPMDSTDQASDQRAAPSTVRAGIAIAIIVTCQLMVVLDATVVNIALTQIRASLHFSVSGLSWVINAYTLTFGGLMLLGGRAGDIFGRRRLMVLGLVVFSVASLAGGLAVSPAMLVAARAVQGVGAAMAAPSTLALIAATFGEGHARNRALSIFSGVSAGAGSLGLILGGVLTSGASWRWVLFINVPIGLAVVVLATRFVPEPPRHDGRLDISGGLLSTAGLAALIYCFIWIAEGHSSAGPITGLFVAAAVLLAAFVVVEVRRSSPLLPIHLVTDRTRGLVYLALLAVSAAVFAMLFFISQYAQNVLHYSALRTGVAFLPLTIAIFLFSRIMPKVLARTGPRIPLLCGPALMAASMAWLSQVAPSQGYVNGLLGPFLLFGIGAGVSYVPMSATILQGVDRGDTGAASGTYQAMQQIGGSVGLAILVTVAASHGQAAALEGAAGFAALAVVLAALATIRRSPRAPARSQENPKPQKEVQWR